MKFMVHWSVDQENWVPVLQKWTSMTAKEQMDAGKGVKILGRWHEMASRTGVAILEASNAAAVMTYLGQWNPHMDIDISPVVDDAGATKAGKTILNNLG